jgi:hypothetical protein
MNTINKMQEISSRIELLEQSAQWIAKESIHSDNAISQTGTLITALADEIREKLFDLVKLLEKKIEISGYH